LVGKRLPGRNVREPLGKELFVGVLLLRLSRLSIVLRLPIELVLALLTAERIVLALVRTGGRSLILVYLHSTNRIFSHKVPFLLNVFDSNG
jgi:hypothetical protein